VRQHHCEITGCRFSLRVAASSQSGHKSHAAQPVRLTNLDPRSSVRNGDWHTSPMVPVEGDIPKLISQGRTAFRKSGAYAHPDHHSTSSLIEGRGTGLRLCGTRVCVTGVIVTTSVTRTATSNPVIRTVRIWLVAAPFHFGVPGTLALTNSSESAYKVSLSL
jgi:hypothetical protein